MTTAATPAEQFDRDGYLIIEDAVVDEAVLDGVIDDLAGLYEEAGVEREESGVMYAGHRIMDAWRISANVKAIALNPRILGIVEEAYGRKPLPFQTLNFPYGTEQAPHSDAIHFNSLPPGYMCGVWVALEDLDMDNGPLVYYPGSHKLPEITMQDVGAEAKPEDYPRYEDYIEDVIARHGLSAKYGTIEKGQALVWAANLLHGGTPLKDKTRSRHSQVTHVFFEGCKYYTPLLSKDMEDHVSWRDPTWIT
jgi:ectoine hydroxylase-related dioxygenase (phytanoyl-CoA dioxygenase family)